MTVEEITLALFTFSNSIRIFGYLPQLLRSTRDESGGSSTSVTTWTVFSAANASTAAYAFVQARDPLMAVMFSLNALCCILITMVTLWKRRRPLVLPSGDMAGRAQRDAPPERARPVHLQADEETSLLLEPKWSRMGTDAVNALQQRQRIGMHPGAMRAPRPMLLDRLAILHDGKGGPDVAGGDAKTESD